jgi:hypothetical protein
MANEEMMTILRDIQAGMEGVQADMKDVQTIVKDIQAEQRNQRQVNGWIRQNIRMHKTALNDFERTRVSTGEIEAIHEELNGVIDRIDDLFAEVDRLKRR